MFDNTKRIKKDDLSSTEKLAKALIIVINEVQELTKEFQKLRVDVDKLIENNK